MTASVLNIATTTGLGNGKRMELEGHDDDPGNDLRIQFRQTIAPFWDVMNRVKEALMVLAATSSLGGPRGARSMNFPSFKILSASSGTLHFAHWPDSMT